MVIGQVSNGKDGSATEAERLPNSQANKCREGLKNIGLLEDKYELMQKLF